MLKVGLLSPFLPEKDGIAIYSDNLLRGLGKKRDHIVTIGRKGGKADYIVDFRSFSLREELEHIVRKEKLNLLHIQYIATFFSKYFLNYNLISALELSIPIVVTLHEVHYSNKGIRNKILQHIEKSIIKKATRIIVHTSKQKEFLKKRYKTNKIVVVYHGLRLNKIPKKKKEKNILCFGMISDGKGVPYLIEAMQYLPSYNLTIAGKFTDKKTKKEVMAVLRKSKSKIETHFEWIGEKEKEKYYKAANIVILPHVWAPYQSGVLHNAVGWGLPVVVTKTGALYELVEVFRFGEIVQLHNPAAIAVGVKKVFKNYKKYMRGIEEYRKIANWPKISKEHFDLYKGIILEK